LKRLLQKVVMRQCRQKNLGKKSEMDDMTNQ
jgi:hypothetical protein